MDYSRAQLVLTLLVLQAWRPAFSEESDDGTKLLLGNRANIHVIDTKNLSSIELIVDDIEYTMSCDYIYSDNMIFWVDGASDFKKIQSVYSNVSYDERNKHDVISTGLVQPDGLACDWIGKKIYWTDSDANHIEVSELDGRARTVLIWDQIDQPRAIALDPLRGYMYWTDWGENPKIERAGMDGSHRKVLVERDGIYWPNGLTIDYDENKVYWVDANYHYINRMNTDGSGREVVVRNTPYSAGDNTGNYDSESDMSSGLLQHPFSITLSGNRIYWTDWATNSIHSSDINGTGQKTVIKNDISTLHDIRSYGFGRQKQAPNPCGFDNGGCSHLCLISPKSPNYTCACPTGVLLQSDGKTCKQGPEHILLLARRPDIRVISLDTPDFTDVVLPFNGVSSSVAIDYDPVDDMVYWSSTVEHEEAILRAKLDGSMEEKIVSHDIEQCDGIAVDWVARNIYWSEALRHYIAVSRLNGTSKKVIIEEGIESPRAIVLDPSKGQMYWSDWGIPKIERASMDGSDRHVFVNTSIHWPNGLAIDYKRGLLYWAEASLDKIEVIGLNGSGRRVLLQEKIPHIFGFSYLDDYLYWTDWGKRKVERMLVFDSKSRHAMIEELPDLMGIKASSVTPIAAENACVKDNGGCSHLCLYTPRGVRCQCPDGYELLSDKMNCFKPEAFLLFTLGADGVHRISLEIAPSASVEVSLKPNVDATVLDSLVETETVFWTDSDHKAISRANMNGTDLREIVAAGVGTVEDIAVDWIGRNIYWTDSESNRIEMAKVDGSSRRPVVRQNLHTPTGLTVDPNNGFIYWSEWGGRPRICRARMDGSGVTVLLGDGMVGRANSLLVDFQQMRLYWVDLDANEIASSNMTGGDTRRIFADDDNIFFSIALYDDYLFWTKGTVIERANKTDGSNRVFIQNYTPSPSISDMLVYHASRQTGVSACSHGNGGCQHLCLTLPDGGHKCACPAQHTLKSDNVSCSAPDEFLLYIKENEMRRIVFDHGLNPDDVLPLRGLKSAEAVAYDAAENVVLWICDGGIHRSHMNGNGSQTLYQDNASDTQPYGMAVDTINRMLYWTDSRKNTISVMGLNGTLIGDIVSDSVWLVGDTRFKEATYVMPRQISVSPKRAQIFFSSACSDYTACRESIFRSYVDGTEVAKLFYSKLRRVSGLVVDNGKDRLYWSDSVMDSIESSDLDGNDRRTFQSNVAQPYGLTVFGSGVYWVSKDRKLASHWQIETAKKSDQRYKAPRKVKGLNHEVKGLFGVTKMNRRGLDEYRCSANNGGCSHICVGKEDGTVSCSCPLHLKLINALQCGKGPTCTTTEFACTRGKQNCIPLKWRCDGDPECDDGSDEDNCPPCQARDSFHCGTGVDGTDGETARAMDKMRPFLGVIQNLDSKLQQCVKMEQRCDGSSDCMDGSDEKNCACAEHQFRCGNGRCVSGVLKCNGRDDCGDQSDENCVEQDGVAASAIHADNTVIIAVISCVAGVLVIGILIAVKYRKKSSNGVTVGGVYTKKDGGKFHFNFKITHDETGRDDSETRHPRSSGGRSTASVNVSLTADRSGHIVPAEMSTQHRRHDAQYFGPVPYAGGPGAIMPRPNIPGASSSTSSGHGRKFFMPTLNPPPSPATDRSGSKMAGDGHYSTDSQSTRAPPCHKCRGGHRHRRTPRGYAHVPVPHPTPCPSDSYDDCVSHSGTSVREFDSISWRSKSGGAPSSPPPPYCYCCHHAYPPAYVGCGGAPYYAYPPSSCRSSHRGYRGPTAAPDPHRHSSSSSGSTRAGQDYLVMCCGRSGGRYHHAPGRKMFGALPRRPCNGYDVNSDSDPFAPPPTPRSQYLSDYCCTHDEAEENHDDEPYLDASGKSGVVVDLDQGKGRDAAFVSNSDDEKMSEDRPLLVGDESPANSAEIDFPILNPPPSPVAELS